MLKTLTLPRHLGIWFQKEIYDKGRRNQLSYVYLKHGLQQTTQKDQWFSPSMIVPTEKFVYKISTYIHICRNWKLIITIANWKKPFMTFDK